MSTLAQLNARTLEMRKARHPLAATFQQIQAGATAAAKARALDAEVTDADAVTALKKAQKNARDMYEALTGTGLKSTDERYAVVWDELREISALLPPKASEADVRAAAEQHLTGVEDRSMKAMGGTMAALKAKFGDALDPAEANQIVRGLLA